MNYCFVDEKFLDKLVFDILNNNQIEEFEEIYKNEKIVELEKIQKLVNYTKNGIQKSFNLSIFKAGDMNIIDLNVNIAKDTKGKINFYLSGRYLKKYCSRLLHVLILDSIKKKYIILILKMEVITPSGIHL